MKEPLYIVLSGPGGAGKSTVVRELVNRYPNLWLSKSWTTRLKRKGESDSAYNFVTVEEFEKKISENGFLEHTNFLGNYYGSPLPDPPPDKDVVLEIEVDGARQIRKLKPDALLIFLEAPSHQEQLRRLNVRGDSEEKIKQRLAKSAEEVSAGEELSAQKVINYDVDSTVETVWKLIQSAK